MKRWHDFEEGQDVRRDEVVEACRKHINTPGAVEDTEQKLRYLDEIESSSSNRIVFKPTKGWGRSPMNPNAWTTPAGEPIRKSSNDR